MEFSKKDFNMFMLGHQAISTTQVIWILMDQKQMKLRVSYNRKVRQHGKKKRHEIMFGFQIITYI